MSEQGIDSLYEDLDDPMMDDTNDLIPNDLVDPDLADIDDLVDDDEPTFDNEDDILNGQDQDDKTKTNKDKPSADDDDVIELVENSVINEILLAKGIVDPKAIKYENEAGEIEEVDFYSLPYEDQLEILKSDASDKGSEFTEHELEVVNFLRTQNVSFDDVIAYYQREAVENYLRESNGENFVVDDYDDQELYLMDLSIKYDDWTEDELKLELEKELQHEELFKKKVDKLRQEYIALEQQDKELEANKTKAKADEDLETLTQNLVGVAVATEDIGGITLEDNDKNAILSTILEKDMNGNSKFIKGLDNPQTLFELAWYAEKGKEAFNIIHDYYKKQIDEVRKTAFANGKSSVTKAAKATVTSNKNGKVNFTRTDSKVQNKNKMSDIDDLFD